MLTWKDGRLYVGNASFALPAVCKVHDHPRAFPSNGIVLASLDETVTVEANFEFGEGGAEASLQKYLADFLPARMKARSFSGNTGWCAESRGERYAYLEVRFDVSTGVADRDGHAVNIFRVSATAPREADLRALRKSPMITQLLNSFQP